MYQTLSRQMRAIFIASVNRPTLFHAEAKKVRPPLDWVWPNSTWLFYRNNLLGLLNFPCRSCSGVVELAGHVVDVKFEFLVVTPKLAFSK